VRTTADVVVDAIWEALEYQAATVDGVHANRATNNIITYSMGDTAIELDMNAVADNVVDRIIEWDSERMW